MQNSTSMRCASNDRDDDRLDVIELGQENGIRVVFDEKISKKDVWLLRN